MSRLLVGKVAIGTLAAVVWSTSSHALVAKIDFFEGEITGATPSVIFQDSFSNGTPPSQESVYAVNAGTTFPAGAESGGLLTLDTASGGLTATAAGQARQAVIVTRLTNNNPANPTSGLTKSAETNVWGLFTLVVPSGPLINAYGVQVIESVQGQSSVTRLVQTSVQYSPNAGSAIISFLEQDFVNDVVTVLGSVAFAPPAGADRVGLAISHRANTNLYFGEYGFFSGGVEMVGQGATFSTAGTLSTDFVRGRFFASTAVPEPATLALLGLGFAGLAASRRRRLG